MNKLALLGGAVALIFLSRIKAHGRVTAPPSSFSVVPGGKISSPYLKFRGHRHDGSEIIHQGVDIKAPKGTPVNAVSDGIIDKIWLDGQVFGYGNTILLANEDGTGALYSHLNSFADIYEGMPVNKGETIGYVGQTQKPRPEMKTAPHLHLEILAEHTRRINPNTPERLDPVAYIRNQGLSIG